MASAEICTFLILLCVTIAVTEVEIITQPKPGQEYVFVQSAGLGARPITRKDKTELHSFETSHKLPSNFRYTLKELVKESKINKREAKADAPVLAPAGAIKLNVAKLLEKYKDELKTSTTAKPKVTTTRRRTRTKKEVTSPSPILTTAAPVARRIEDDDIPLVASGSEKQRSRIQIKKGPNGQEYEYEYVYYYYDDDEDGKRKENVSNSHDGPARTRGNPEKTSATPEVNEVLPKSRTRGRQLDEEETVGEERLPANTRFPPRSRNLNTTPLPEEEVKTRGRGRGRPSTEAAPEDNVSDESQGNRGRTRANVRRPSLDLVDNVSFNTYSHGAEPVASGGPSFPTELPAGPVRFLGATPNESVDLPSTQERAETPKKPAIVKPEPEEATTNFEVTTIMSPMDKVALDLYAILQGTQKLSGEDNDTDEATDASAENEITTLEPTTEQVETTTTSTTTTTTTTTPAPTTTTKTEASVLGRGRFKGRGGLTRKTTHSSSSTTEASHEPKPKGKFNRPSFGNRPRARTTPEPEESKEELKPSQSKPRRFGNTRSRTRTTSAPETEEASSHSTPSRPSLTRPRASFNLRTRGRTTTPAAESEPENDAASPVLSSTTTRTRRIGTGANIRPLRPGPRINLSRNRPGQSTSTTTEAPVEDHVTGDDTQESAKEDEPKEETSSVPVDNSPLGRLKNRNRLNIQPKPKAAASAPVQVRRINPLLARRRPGQTPEPTSTSEAPQEATEAAAEEETEPSTSSSTTTTEEPRGLNKLLAGRRRLARPGLHQ